VLDSSLSQSPASRLRAIVFHARPDDSRLAGRTLRSIRAAGLEPEEFGPFDSERLAPYFQERRPLLFMRAGAWLVDTRNWLPPPASATGRGLCALGAVKPWQVRSTQAQSAPTGNNSRDQFRGDELSPLHPGPGVDAQQAALGWKDLLSQTGGDLNRLVDPRTVWSFEPHALFLDSIAVAALIDARLHSLGDIFRSSLLSLRVVHCASLDAYDDPGLRVMQVITSLQRGGAERVTLDLMAELPGFGVAPRLATLGRPTRDAFAAPPQTLDLAGAIPTPAARLDALADQCIAGGADLVHGHLIPGEAARRVSARGLPVMLTIHNTREAWPPGVTELGPSDVLLLTACARAVERELRSAGIKLPARTAHNGIDHRRFRLTPERIAARGEWRKRWSFGADDFVLIAIANPRPQKRLHRLPAILAEVRRRLGPGRQARFVLCGEPMRGNPQAAESVALLRGEIARLGLEPHVHWAGAVVEVSEVLATADVLVSASAHEGLSLAYLEALAMGCPVVATDVGGTGEIASDNPRLQLLPPDASAAQYAEAIIPLARMLAPLPVVPLAFLHNWSSRQMAARYQWLYQRAIAASARTRRGHGRGIWLVTNNFSTGGAQSSARRLLLGLTAQGIPVRAAVIEEHSDNPTPGRLAVLQAGIPVVVLPAGLVNDLPSALEHLLRAIDADPPQSVLFWNLRPAFKIGLADALLDIPVFDISPGEMFFDSLARHFAKTDGASPYRTARDYGVRLAGVIVKYAAEADRAAQVLGAPVHVAPNGVPLPGAIDFPPAAAGQGAFVGQGEGGSSPPATSEARRRRESGDTSGGLGGVIFGTAARVHPQKRLEDLIEAFKLAYPRMPACALRIAGGTEAGCEEYEALLRKSCDGLPVEWVGEVADMPVFHRCLDVFVMVSEPAGCPNASLEAMAAGLPVIATNRGGASEQVLDGKTGLLVAPRDPTAMAAAMMALASQPQARRRMGNAARVRIGQQFSLERMLADYSRICLGP